MNIVNVEGFHVVGHEARTTNEREMRGAGVIGKMWSENMPNGGPVIAVYCEYASDKDGEYSYLLGLRSGDDDTLPVGNVRRAVEHGQYLMLEYRGEVSPEAVVGLWRRVWEMEAGGEIRRAYRTDFERYQKTGVELLVGMK